MVAGAHDERRRGPVLRRAFVDVVAAEAEEGFLHGAPAFGHARSMAHAFLVREVGERRVLSCCFFEAVGEGRVVDDARGSPPSRRRPRRPRDRPARRRVVFARRRLSASRSPCMCPGGNTRLGQLSKSSILQRVEAADRLR